MHSFCADHTDSAIHIQTAGQNHFRLNTADRGKLEITVFRNGCNDKTDFIHMRAQHNLFIRRFSAFFISNYRAERIHLIFTFAFDLINDKVSYCTFIAGCSV